MIGANCDCKGQNVVPLWYAARHVIASAVLIAATASVGRSQGHGSPPESIDEVVAALSDGLTSIDSLLCDYTIQFSNSPSVKRARFARSGEKWHYAELSSADDSEITKEIISCFDGELVYLYRTSKSKDGKDSWGSVQLQDPRQQTSLDPDYLLGTKLSNVSRSIIDVLKNCPATRESGILPGDRTGPRLLVHSVTPSRTGPNLPKYDVSVLLDPIHDWLPSEILVTQSEPFLKLDEWQQYWKIREFRKVRDERNKLDRWFPTSGVLNQRVGAPSVELLVQNVQINPELNPSLFRPEIPDGVLLADATSTGRGRMALKGRKFMVDSAVNDLAGKARSAVPVSNTWKYVVAINGIIVVAIVLGYLASRRGTKTRHT